MGNLDEEKTLGDQMESETAGEKTVINQIILDIVSLISVAVLSSTISHVIVLCRKCAVCEGS